MERLLTLFTYYSIFILVMMNQNNGDVKIEIFRYDINNPEPYRIYPSTNPISPTLSAKEGCVIQIFEFITPEETCNGSVHLWLGQEAPLEVRLGIIEKFVAAVEKMTKICLLKSESVRLFREVQGYESKRFTKMMNRPSTIPQPKLFKIKSTKEDIIIRKVPIDNTRVKEKDALVLFCYEGIFIFLGDKITGEEKRAAIIFSNLMESVDSINYELVNRIPKIIDERKMNRWKKNYAYAQPVQLSDDNFLRDRYKDITILKLFYNQEHWMKTPEWKEIDNNKHDVALKLVDYKEKIMFLHIFPDVTYDTIKRLFIAAESETWLQNNLTQVSVLQDGQYTVEFLIHFPGKEKIHLMALQDRLERNKNKISNTNKNKKVYK